MRCGCPECGAFMIQTEGLRVQCVCPDCGYQCAACLGTGSAVQRGQLLSLQSDPRFRPEKYAFAQAAREDSPEAGEQEEPQS